jgi:hypothetical protein
MNPTLISVAKAAKKLRLTTASIRRYCRMRRLNAKKYGRDWWLDPEEVARFKPNPSGNPDWQK